MKGRIISSQYKFEVQYTDDNGVRKYLHLVPETITKYLYIGKEVEFDIVGVPNTNATFTSENGWDQNPIQEYLAKIVGDGFDKNLYSDIEHAIIKWSIDGTKTAGTLTREIMELLSKESWEDVEEEYSKDEYPVFGGPFTNAKTPFEWLRLNYNTPTRK
jgi:hypothetical protein